MTNRVQIPVDDADHDLFRRAAQKMGLSLAEWARRLLRSGARKDLGPDSQTPEEALEDLFALEAPVADVEQMIAESTEGRYP